MRVQNMFKAENSNDSLTIRSTFFLISKPYQGVAANERQIFTLTCVEGPKTTRKYSAMITWMAIVWDRFL